MKSILVGPKVEEEKPLKYPYIGISKKGRVVLFTDCGTGTLLHEPEHYHGVGHHNHSWCEDEFELLQGKIILSND